MEHLVRDQVSGLHVCGSTFEDGDLAKAQQHQLLPVKMVMAIQAYSRHPGHKAMMKLIGLDCGLNRLPVRALRPDEVTALKSDMEAIGFFDWGRWH